MSVRTHKYMYTPIHTYIDIYIYTHMLQQGYHIYIYVCMYICIKIYGIPVDANHLAEIMLIKHLHNNVTVFPLQLLFWSSHRDRGREWGVDTIV